MFRGLGVSLPTPGLQDSPSIQEHGLRECGSPPIYFLLNIPQNKALPLYAMQEHRTSAKWTLALAFSPFPAWVSLSHGQL